MKKVLMLMLLVVSMYSSNDFTQKEFWQKDKIDHFGLSMGIAGTGTAIARHYGNSKFDSFLYGVAGSVVIGLAKEIADGHDPLNHTEDIGDLYADVLGSIAGSLLTFQWRW